MVWFGFLEKVRRQFLFSSSDNKERERKGVREKGMTLTDMRAYTRVAHKPVVLRWRCVIPRLAHFSPRDIATQTAKRDPLQYLKSTAERGGMNENCPI